MGEGEVAELAHRMLLAEPDDPVAGFVSLEDPPHRIHEIPGKTPVAPSFEVSERDPIALAGRYLRHRAGYLAGHEVFAAAG